jgi:IS30 family transposase
LTNTEAPKGSDIAVHPEAELDQVAAELNDRPRKTLGWKTPAEAFLDLLSNPPIVATTA